MLEFCGRRTSGFPIHRHTARLIFLLQTLLCATEVLRGQTPTPTPSPTPTPTASYLWTLKDSAFNEVAAVDEFGNLFLTTAESPGEEIETNISSTISSGGTSWSVKTDEIVCKIELSGDHEGKIRLKGQLYEGFKGGDLPSAGDPFSLKNASGVVVASVSSSGDLHLRGRLDVKKPGTAVYFVSVDDPAATDAGAGTFAEPFETIPHARDYLRDYLGTGSDRDSSTDMESDVVVYIRAGRYETPESFPYCFAFDYRHSGNNGHTVTYRSYPSESPSLSGGRILTGWSGPDADGIYQASLPSDVFANRRNDPAKTHECFEETGVPIDRSLWFRQLYVNGHRAIRARWPNKASSTDISYNGDDYKFIDGAYDKTSTGPLHQTIQIHEADLDSLGSSVLVDLLSEIRSENHTVEFINFYGVSSGYLRILDVVKAGGSPTGEPWNTISDGHPRLNFYGTRTYEDDDLTIPDIAFSDPGPDIHDSEYYIENARALLDAPGEWYLDVTTPTVSYMPLSSELSGETFTGQVIYPHYHNIITLWDFFYDDECVPNYNIAYHVENIIFQGLTCEHTTYGRQSDPSVGPAHEFDGLIAGQANISRGTTISAAIDLIGANNIIFAENRIRHAGGDGIRLNRNVTNCSFIGNVITDTSGTGIREQSETMDEDTTSNVFSNNYITFAGQEFHGALGMFNAGSINSLIRHNELDHLPWTGMHVGWTWAKNMTGAEVSANRIHHTTELFSDGGGIYTARERVLPPYVGEEPLETTNTLNHWLRDLHIVENYVYELEYHPRALPFTTAPVIGIYMDQWSASDSADHPIQVMRNVVVPATNNPPDFSAYFDCYHTYHIDDHDFNDNLDLTLNRGQSATPIGSYHLWNESTEALGVLDRHHIEQSCNHAETFECQDTSSEPCDSMDYDTDAIILNAGLEPAFKWIVNWID